MALSGLVVRRARVDVEGGVDHVYNRVASGEGVFADPVEAERFVDVLMLRAVPLVVSGVVFAVGSALCWRAVRRARRTTAGALAVLVSATVALLVLTAATDGASGDRRRSPLGASAG